MIGTTGMVIGLSMLAALIVATVYSVRVIARYFDENDPNW